MKKKLFIAIVTIMVLGGCVSPFSSTPKEIDRGKIPNPTNPVMPPSLTNEWINIIENDGYEDFVMIIRE